jgi:hypothetical protein|eukprot:COSAG06_NODE_441_length_15740_cov_6.214144_9_plen_202_part_00
MIPGGRAVSPQRNVHIFRKLLVDQCGGFLALLRLGGAGVSAQVQVLAQRLYACISSVITGDVDPRCLISVLEEFMMLEACDVRLPRGGRPARRARTLLTNRSHSAHPKALALIDWWRLASHVRLSAVGSGHARAACSADSRALPPGGALGDDSRGPGTATCTPTTLRKCEDSGCPTHARGAGSDMQNSRHRSSRICRRDRT